MTISYALIFSLLCFKLIKAHFSKTPYDLQVNGQVYQTINPDLQLIMDHEKAKIINEDKTLIEKENTESSSWENDLILYKN